MTGRLRPMRADDATMILSWRNALHVRANVFHPEVISADQHAEWMATTLKSDDRAYFVFEAENVPRALVGLTRIDRLHRRCDWGFYTAPDAPRGTATRMLELAAEHAFGELNLRKISAEVLGHNVASLRLHEKLGFQREGVRSRHHLVDGVFQDVVLFAKFAEDA